MKFRSRSDTTEGDAKELRPSNIIDWRDTFTDVLGLQSLDVRGGGETLLFGCPSYFL